MKIPLTRVFKNVGEINKTASKILEQLHFDEHFARTKEELCFYVLSFFEFPNGSINIKEELSIQSACHHVLHMMGFDDDSLLKYFGKDGIVNYIDAFMQDFIGYRHPPGRVYDELEATVKFDLNTINKYITKYEEEDFIKNDEKPRNHAQRVIKDYYNRCIEERDKIKQHLAIGLKDRALQKAVGLGEFASIGLHWSQIFWDRPYRMPFPDSEQFFDVSKIDSISHRVYELTIHESRALIKKYRTDKRAFYGELETTISAEQAIQSLISFINYNPMIHTQRKQIANELKELFNQKNWFGFYALGLTQIEGLFGDMCKMCDPTYFNPKASLSDKVNFIQKYYPNNETRLDHFAFEVPNQRNTFLHNGIETKEDIDLLCKDLLYDLIETLRIFNSLNTDANRLHKITSEADITNFYSCKSFCIYFNLLKAVRDKGQESIFKSRVNDLNISVFPELLFNLAFDLNEKYQKAWAKLKLFLMVNSQELSFILDLDSITNQEIQEKAPEIKEHMHYVTTWNEDEFEELLYMKQFIETYHNYVDVNFLTREVQITFTQFKSSFLPNLKKIFQIAHIIGFELR